MRKSLLMSAAWLLGFIGVLPVSAAVVDQEYWVDRYATVGFQYEAENGHIERSICGQEFVPSISGLVGLDLGLVRVEWNAYPEADAEIYIHEDTIFGDVVGQATLSGITRDPNTSDPYFAMHVDFQDTVLLDVGRTYVIEVYEIESDTFAWRLGGNGYLLGGMYWGAPWQEESDYLFRTYATPEPMTLSLFGIGVLTMLRRKK